MPAHAPEAVQLVALVVDQVRVDAEPLANEIGSAVIVTVGADVDVVTVTDLLAVPPVPLQFNVNTLLAAVSAPVLAEPATARLPDHAPDAVQPVAFVDDQVSELLPPLATFVGLAVIVTVGAGVGPMLEIATVADACALATKLEQMSV